MRDKGQVIVFYALLIPIFLIVICVGMDFGWYYLNVSRLQNAADASVLAGAKVLVKKEKINNVANPVYKYKVKLVDKYPANRPNGSIDITDSNNAAHEYAKKNLAANSAAFTLPSLFSVAQAEDDLTLSYTLQDSYTRGDPTVTLTPSLYKDDDDNYYYVIHLTEDIHHFFIGFLDDMAAPVVAVAKLYKNDDSRQIIFNANGGTIVKADDPTNTTDKVTIYIDDLLKDSASVYAALPSEYSSTPIREGYEFFRYWTDTPENGKIIPYAQKLTKDNVDEFFATYDPDGTGVVTLYAQWRKLESSSTPVTLKFDTNGGTFFDNSTTDSKNIKRASAMDDDETTDPITANKGTPERDGYEFLGWSTDPKVDSNSLISNYIQDGKQLTKNEVATLFGNNTTVTLYAVWKKVDDDTEEVKPHNNKTLWEQMHYLIAKNVYDSSWDVSTAKYGNGALYHNSFRAPTYFSSYHYYTETISMNEYDEQQYWLPESTKRKYRKIGEQTQYFIDFCRRNTLNGGNYGIGLPKYGISYNTNYRVHSLLNVNTLYEVRSGHGDDPLYCRFEGEPYVGDDTPIRQIIININVNNIADNYRPLFFYYDGPDARTVKSSRIDVLKPENAQPVILNLNADFKGVLFMPDVPVVINGNGHKFEGFIIAKEFRYLSTSDGTEITHTPEDTKFVVVTGEPVWNSSKNRWDDQAAETKTIKKTYPSTTYRIDSNGNIKSIRATGATAQATYDSYATKKNYFNLSSSSKFRQFKVENNVNFMYVFYDNTLTMKEEPFHEYYDLNRDLIPLYKLDEYGNQVRVTKWEDVKLYDSDDFTTRNEIPKTITGDTNIRTVRLTNGEPSPLYDEAGNPVYFCDDYIKLTGTYTIFTLDTVTEGKHGTPTDSKEFLITKIDSTGEIISDTDEWI